MRRPRQTGRPQPSESPRGSVAAKQTATSGSTCTHTHIHTNSSLDQTRGTRLPSLKMMYFGRQPVLAPHPQASVAIVLFATRPYMFLPSLDHLVVIRPCCPGPRSTQLLTGPRGVHQFRTLRLWCSIFAATPAARRGGAATAVVTRFRAVPGDTAHISVRPPAGRRRGIGTPARRISHACNILPSLEGWLSRETHAAFMMPLDV